MRPVSLTMQNFGTFYERTTVDFNSLGDGIYLITGPTGSGKTTIFDAMVYALYGTASGSGRTSLGTDSFYSDFGLKDSPKRPMTVEFTFTNNNIVYKVERRLYWGATGTASKTSRTSELRENGILIARSDKTEKKDDVTQKITEILGMQMDQFSKIVMLAQGEFRKFLEADSAAREEILGKLFDNKAHRDLMNRLKAVTKKLSGMEKELNAKADNTIENLSIPEDYPDSEKDKLTINHPECIGALAFLLSCLEEQQQAVENSKKKLQEELAPLQEQYTLAVEANRLLENLKQTKEELEKLRSREEEYNALQGKVNSAKKAEKLMPMERHAAETERRLSDEQRNLSNLMATQKRLQEEKEILAGRSAKVEETNKPLIQEKTSGKQQLESILPCYDERSAKKKALETAEKILKKAEDGLEQANLAVTGFEQKQSELEKTLSELADAGESAVSLAENNRKTAEEKVNALRKLSGELSTLKELQARSEKLYACYLDKLAEKKEKESASEKLSRRFLSGQAGALARELRETIQSSGQGVCPVCGAVHTSADLEQFAALPEGIPSQDEVEAAQSSAREAADAAQNAFKEASIAEEKRKAKKTAIQDSASALLEFTDQEIIFTSNLVKESCADAEKALRVFKNVEAQAREKAGQKKATESGLQNVKDELSAAKKKAEIALENRNTALTDKTGAEVAYKEKATALSSYPDTKQKATDEISKLSKEIDCLNEQIRTAKLELEQCEKTVSKTDGQIRATGENLQSRKEEASKAADAFETAVAEQFGSAAEYKDACAPESVSLDEKKLSSWIKSEETKIKHFTDILTSSAGKVDALEKTAAGKEFTDISALKAQLDGYERQIRELTNREKELYSNLSADRKVFYDLQKIKGQLRKVQGALKKIKPMDDAANGKFSFSRFALLDSFKTVIDHANEHLDVMTDGEYVLEQTDDETGTHKKGLGLCVRNTITGTRREKQSLSGGQSFEASLALALGLSDVAQSRSTGMIQIDSMFIDEGFGSLDEDRLNKTINVLNSVSDGYRQIGIISHVAGLDDLITKKLVVTATDHGSYIKNESDL